MSIKKLFDGTDRSRQYLTDQEQKNAFKEIESSKNLKQLSIKQETLTPQVDYSDPSNFAKFGSAYLYYKSAIERVLDFYPYDGSDAELNEFYNKSLPIEKHIFDKLYPRTNGYITMCTGGWSALDQSYGDGYGLPTTTEYITFYGGPNISSELKTLKEMTPNDLSSKFQNNNIYDESVYETAGLQADFGKGTRESNLKSNFDTGITVEFWLKTGSLGSSLTTKQVVYDMWNSEGTSSADYGRITIELTGGAGSGNPLLITAQSGNASSSAQMCFTSSIGNNLSASSLSEWAHYAITVYNSGSDLKAALYVDGYLNDTNTYSGGKLGELSSKNMIGRIGALVTSPSGSSAPAAAGKLSGSLDEFRFWKIARNGAQIGKYWFDQIRGGVNTDISNTELGMYYKFNEGITGDTSVDSVVLDYGGRLCNGVWTGYTTNSRNTGSAILSSSAAIREYEDPIVYASHPLVTNLKDVLLSTGSFHDEQNSALVRNLVPAWLTEDTKISQLGDLDKVCHIMGAYFDILHLQIGNLPTLKHINYTSASSEALPFAQHLPQSLGLYTPEIFVDASILEKFKNRTDKEHFQNNLVEAKNLIYSNLYNNLASIYKSKGTEKAIRNTLRCFNLNDTLVSYNIYSNNQQYDLKNSLKQTLKSKTYANFNTNDGLTSVIYQAADPHSDSSRGYISASQDTGKESKYGFTAEASVLFPKFIRSIDSFDRKFLDVSLFGIQTVNTASISDTAFLTGGQDTSNFQVYAVRDSPYSKNAYFVLTSSTEPYNFPTLTSSLFFDVYDESNWNLSVRLKPSNYPFTDSVSGSTDYNYDVIFRGTNNNLGTILNAFETSSSVTKAVGQEIMAASKRLYVGARNTNITGANIYESDVLISTAKYWTKYIDATTLNQHLFDTDNYGVSGSYEHVSILDENIQNTHNFDTLALNWYFGNVSSSDAGGNFYVTDLSSGSADRRASTGWIGNVASHIHSAKGDGFYPNDTNVVKTKNVNEFKFVDPERSLGSDMIQILDADDQLYGTVDQIPNYVYTVEKSLYAAVTEEILDFFAGAIDFHHLIGQPVNRYRMQYKALEHLRRVYFERVKDVSTVEKFTEYYKWFDDAISIIIGQLVPASADFVADSFNTVESHVFERNKYKSQFPTIEFRSPDPEPSVRGIGEATWPYSPSRSPLPSSPRNTGISKEYWQKRAETTSPEITSGDVIIDRQRQTFKEVIWSTPNLSKSMPTISNIDGVTYRRNQNLASQQNATYLFDATFNRNIKGGTNFDSTKNIGFTYNNVAPAGPVYAPSGGVYVPQNVLFADIADLVKIQRLEMSTDYWRRVGLKPNEKIKRVIKVMAGRDHKSGIGYTSTKSTLSFPFNIISSSVVSGFNSGVVALVTASIEITNLHNDVYGEDMERPMQTRWSEYAAGGHQSRHIGLNISGANKSDVYKGLDDYTTRPEAWKILIGNCNQQSGAIAMVAPDYPWPEANEPGIAPYPMTASQKATYYRDFTAKTPYVFKNIRMRTGSTILGNYRNNYEIVHTVGAWNNPRQFIEIGGQPNLPTGAFPNTAKFATQIRSFLDIHRGGGHGSDASALGTGSHFQFVQEYDVGYLSGTENKTVIVSKFSNPGGLEVTPAGYGDVRSNEFSVYNATLYRNMTVIKPSQGPAGTISEITGVGGPGIRVGDIHALDYGLRSHLARHTARFGRDSLILPPDGQRASYSLAKPFIGYGDTKFYRSHETLQGWWRLNEDISSTGDAIDDSGNGRDGTFAAPSARPAYNTSLYPSRYIQTASCTFDADTDATNINSAATWQSIIGRTADGGTAKMTFSAWTYYGGPGENNYGRILDFAAGDIMTYTDPSGRLFLKTLWNGAGVHWGTNQTAFTSGSISGSGGWNHAVITYDATDTSNVPAFYIDGNQVDSSLVSGSVTGVFNGILGSDCFIGNNSTNNQCWEGQLSDVAIWNSILTSDEVTAIHNASKLPEKVGPGYANTQLPGFHKVHRNNKPRLKLKTLSYIPILSGCALTNTTGAYWVNNTLDTVLINSSSLTAQHFLSASREYGGLTYTGWVRFTSNAAHGTDNVQLWGIGRSANGDDFFSLKKETTGPDGSSKCATSGSSNCLSFNLSTRSTPAPTSTGTRTTITYRGYIDSLPGADIDDDEWHHIAVSLDGKNSTLTPSISCSFFVDGQQLNTCLNTTNVVQNYFDQYAQTFSSNGFMGYGALDEFDYSKTAANPLSAPNPNMPYRGDEFLCIGGNGWTLGSQANNFSGSMNNITFWSRNLSAAEINTLYNSGSPCDVTCSAPYTTQPTALHVWLPMGNAQNPLSSDQTDVITLNNPTAFTSASHAIWDASGKQNNYFAISPPAASTNAAVFSTGSTDSHRPPMSDIPGCTKTITGYDEIATYKSSSHYDNFYVQHMIPRSDKQYAWITGAIHDPLNEFRYTGYMPVHGTDAGMFSSSYTDGVQPFFNFASASEIGFAAGSTTVTALTARPGTEYMIGHPVAFASYNRQWAAAAPAFKWNPQPCNHINLNIYEPITGSSSTLGWPLGTHLAKSNYDNTPTPANAWPINDNAIQYRNTTMVSASRDEHGGLGTGKLGIAGHFNMLMWKRNGQYGYGTFSQARQADHPVAYDQRKNNKLMVEYKTRGTPQEFDLRPVSLKGRPVTLNFDYETSQIVRSQKITKTANATLKTSYNNEFIYFNSGTLDNHFGIPAVLKSEITPFEQLVQLKNNVGVTLNWVHYKECLFPSLKNEFSSKSSFRSGYDNKFWRDDPKERIKLASDGPIARVHDTFDVKQAAIPNSMGVTAYLTHSSWPLDAPQNFLTRISSSYIYTTAGGFAYYTLRFGGMAGSENFTAGKNPWELTAVPTAVAGELQNTCGWLHQTSSQKSGNENWSVSSYYSTWVMTGLAAGALYARKQTLASPLSINPPNYPNLSCSVQDLGTRGGMSPGLIWGFKTASLGAGEAFWDAPNTAGYLSASRDTNGEKTFNFISASSKPWYNDYEKFKEHDMKFIGRGFSVVPEFRISERLEDYLDSSTQDFRDFSIPGTSFDSADEDFYIDFSNSDFMSKFLDIRKMSDLEAKEIKLTCRAVVKFNPYKGFYPAQRTLDLVSQFSKSYGDSINIEGALTEMSRMTGSMTEPYSGLYRLALQPLFAPGILYNSIKSGIACDWPIVYDRKRLHSENYTGSSDGVSYDAGSNYAWYPAMIDTGWGATENYVTGQFWDERLPFETIINPGKILNGATLVDHEPHPLVAFPEGHTASFGGQPADNLYTLMASNFVAEVGDFFLRGGEYSRLATKGVSMGTMKFRSGEVYGARLRMKTSYSGSRTYEFESGSKGNNTFFTKGGAGGLYNDSSTVTARRKGNTTGSFEIPQDPGRNPGFKRDFVMYSRTTAFGPPIASRIPQSLAIVQAAIWEGLGGWCQVGQDPGDSAGVYGSWIENVNLWNASASASGTMDCMNGYNWGWTPPYYHGEAWCDFIFRPTDNTEYTLEKIVSELETRYWRADPGPQTGSTVEDWGYHYPNMNYSSLIRDNPPLSASTVGGLEGGGQPICVNNSPYSSININDNAMQLNHSLNLFGIENVYKKQYDNFGREILTEREIVGQKWVIQPKFETPMLNFADSGPHPIVGASTGSVGRTKTTRMIAEGTASTRSGAPLDPTISIANGRGQRGTYGFGADTAANGMWHQFGTMPEKANKGIFLEIGDIPRTWLKYHYMCVSESSVYNNFDPSSTGVPGKSNLGAKVKSLADMVGFVDENNKTRLGKVARKRVIKEAVVAIPYILKTLSVKTTSTPNTKTTPESTEARRKQFINIPKSRLKAAMASEEGSSSGDLLDTAGQSIRRLVDKMNDYILPPKFDFLNNPEIKPIVMYMFEFKYELDRDDLSYIWQNLAPRDYERLNVQEDVVAHELFNTELLTEKNIMSNPDLRWMVFKVKQRSQKMYSDKVLPQFGRYTTDNIMKDDQSKVEMTYNWPYDYLSIIELVKLEAEVLYRDDEIEIEDLLIAEGLSLAATATGTDTPMTTVLASGQVSDDRATRDNKPFESSERSKVNKKKLRKGDRAAAVEYVAKKRTSTKKASLPVKKKTKLPTVRKSSTKKKK